MNENDELMQTKKLITISEVAALLDLPLVTIQRWIHQGKIPVKTVKHENLFKVREIIDWAKLHGFTIKDHEDVDQASSNNLLSQAVERGGIYFNLEGDDIYQVLENAIHRLPFIEDSNKNTILNEMLNREEMASTGIGKGIAIPHTRNRLETGIQEITVPVFFLKNAVEFNAIDHLPVQVLFMIFTSNTKDHLHILSKISYLLQQDIVMSILQNKNRTTNLLPEIIKIENASNK